MKRFTPFAIFFAIAALVIGLVAPSSAASTVAQGFLATSPGPTAALAFSGQLQCEVAVNAPGTLAATPQYSSDGVTWVPATVIGNGSINQPGVYIGTNPIAAGYGFLRLNISSFSGSQLSGQLACGDDLPPASGGGSGAVSSVNGGACITVSPITGDTIVTYTCATPVPLTVSTPLVLTTPGNDSINIACPGCSSGGGGANGFPFTIVQESGNSNFPANIGANTTAVATFSNTATSGNTLLCLISTNGSVDTITTPTGWTKIFNEIDSFVQVAAYIKTSAGTETACSATLVSTSTSWAVRILEISGTHAVDQQAVATFSAGAATIQYPAITPSAGSMVFAVAAAVPGGTGTNQAVPASWVDISIVPAGQFNGLIAIIYRGAGTGAALPKPIVAFSTALFDPGVATGIFSIL